MFRRSFSCCTSALNSAAPMNSLEGLITSGVEFYTSVFCEVRALIVDQNPFSQRKNVPNTGGTDLVPTGEMDQKIATSVTTSHVFRPNRRRNAVLSLRFWLPNCDFPPRERRQEGRGGVGRAHTAKGLDAKAHSEFYG
jgi:hypothetical protein